MIFLKEGADRDIDDLACLLDDGVFAEAAGLLKMISKSPDDRQFYEDRIKFLHDEESRLIATREQAFAEGEAKGIEQGREEGREEGAAIGSIAGKIQILQEIVGNRVSSTSELLELDISELSRQLSVMQDRLRSRGN